MKILTLKKAIQANEERARIKLIAIIMTAMTVAAVLWFAAWWLI